MVQLIFILALPFALVFGAVSERFGVHGAAWLVLAAGAAAGALLLSITRLADPTPGIERAIDRRTT